MAVSRRSSAFVNTNWTQADYSSRKKKKSKSSKTDSDRARERERIKELVEQDEAQLVPSGSNAGSGRNSPATTSSRKTDAERRFEEIQRERVSRLGFGMASQFFKMFLV